MTISRTYDGDIGDRNLFVFPEIRIIESKPEYSLCGSWRDAQLRRHIRKTVFSGGKIPERPDPCRIAALVVPKHGVLPFLA